MSATVPQTSRKACRARCRTACLAGMCMPATATALARAPYATSPRPPLSTHPGAQRPRAVVTCVVRVLHAQHILLRERPPTDELAVEHADARVSGRQDQGQDQRHRQPSVERLRYIWILGKTWHCRANQHIAPLPVFASKNWDAGVTTEDGWLARAPEAPLPVVHERPQHGPAHVHKLPQKHIQRGRRPLAVLLARHRHTLLDDIVHLSRTAGGRAAGSSSPNHYAQPG